MRNSHYWIIAYLDNGDGTRQPYLTYGGRTEEDARTKAFDELGGLEFMIRMFPTTDEQEASRQFRGVRLNETKNLKESVRRIRHKKLRRYQ